MRRVSQRARCASLLVRGVALRTHLDRVPQLGHVDACASAARCTQLRLPALASGFGRRAAAPTARRGHADGQQRPAATAWPQHSSRARGVTAAAPHGLREPAGTGSSSAGAKCARSASRSAAHRRTRAASSGCSRSQASTRAQSAPRARRRARPTAARRRGVGQALLRSPASCAAPAAGRTLPSRNRRSAARARHTRDITVPTGMRSTSAHSA